MPEIEISPRKFSDRYVQPFTDAVIEKLPPPLRPAFQAVADGFFAAIGGLSFVNQDITFEIPDPFPDSGGNGGETPLPSPPPGLAPIDPAEVLKAIAAAMGEAEKLLNAENLAIGGATAEVNVVVSIGGLAGANANLKINLGPTPRG
jgi:hypothetical protein